MAALQRRIFSKWVVLLALLILGLLSWNTLRIQRDDGGWHVDRVTHDIAHEEPDPNSPPPPEVVVPSSLADVRNATLGFQKIFVLSMPSRRDKRDVIALAAYVAGLEIEFIDGVPGSEIGKSERPDDWETKFDTDNTVETSLGCWRGHMDIYRKMLLERIQTALVIEDDVDWDVMIKAQMTEVARGTQNMQQAAGADPPRSPYGDHWWYLATGHCSIQANIEIENKYWIIDKDPTVCPEKERDMPFFEPNVDNKDLAGQHKRILFPLEKFMCTGSYAVSIEGASRFIFDQEVELNGETIDMGLAKLCGREGVGKCFGVHPPITGIYEAAGDKSRGSDRVDVPEGEKQPARSNRIVYSSHTNLKQLLAGQTVLDSQYPDSLQKKIDIVSGKIPEGRLVTLKKGDYKEKKKEEKDDKKEEKKEG